MHTHTFDMRVSDHEIMLEEVLTVVPDNSWAWSLCDFDGTGIPPRNMTMKAFISLVTRSEYGYFFTWNELLNFARTVRDLHMCLLFAAKNTADLVFTDPDEADFDKAIMVIEGFDSTTWSIQSKQQDLVARFSSRFFR